MDNLRKSAKYLAEGLVLSLVVFLTTAGKLDLFTVVRIVLVASISFAFLDYLAPSVAPSARLGSGFGVGMGQVGGDSSKNSFSLETSDKCGISDNYGSASDLKSEIIQEINLTPVPNNVGACQMKPYLTDAKRAEAYAEVLEESDDILLVDPVITETPAGKCPHMPYKIIPGQWSEEELIAGYNESVTAANACTGYWTGF